MNQEAKDFIQQVTKRVSLFAFTSGICLFGITWACLLLFGCDRAPKKIHPGGNYVNAYKNQTIIIRENEIEFDVMGRTRGDNQRVRETYTYILLNNGSLVFRPMTSGKFGTGVTAFDWSWNGYSIIRVDPKNGEVMHFEKKP